MIFLDTGKCTWHYNSDLSGDVEVAGEDGLMRIPGSELLAFVAHHLRGNVISKLESMETGDFLNWLCHHCR